MIGKRFTENGSTENGFTENGFTENGFTENGEQSWPKPQPWRNRPRHPGGAVPPRPRAGSRIC
ncbi:hypothetical protein GCM10018780_33760 [Streptomyces lanatus]|nr:hypothetical protein GCM10018780_33760 [Streptomyces lanatus]